MALATLPCAITPSAIKEFLAAEKPLLGICLGFQLLALASGGATQKMKFGHHGANHPVIDLSSGRVMITSQNHGFCVDENSLPSCWQITHRSLFDNSLQGIRHHDKPVIGFSGSSRSQSGTP